MSRLDKLRRMSREEMAWRSRQLLRVQCDRFQARVNQPQWERTRLRTILAPASADQDLLRDLDGGDWPAAHRAMATALRARQCRFVLDPRTATDLRRDVLSRWPGAAADASRRADQIVDGRYDLLGYRGLSFEGANGIDWHFDPVHGRRAPVVFWADVPYLDSQVGDHKVIWEINRHQHWLALGRALWLTGDRKYAHAIVSQLESWLASNPPLTGINWASALELGFRSLSWLWTLHFLLADTHDGVTDDPHVPWTIDLLVALDRQLTHLEQNLSYYFSPNTHLTGEALALYVAGLSLPELAASSRWTATGRRILLAEIDRQIAADGGHAERSTHYHRYTLDFYLMALLMARRAGDEEAVARFTDAVTRTAEFARAMADDEGRLPLIGDDDGGMLWPLTGRACNDIRDSLGLAAVVLDRPALSSWGTPEEAFWIAGRAAGAAPTSVKTEPVERTTESRVFPDTGYVVARERSACHLVFDVGAHGYMNGGHAHADTLSLTLSLAGRPLLIDPGTCTYTVNPPLRDRFRRGENHNTLTLDHRAFSTPAGPFHWRSRTDATLGVARQNLRFDWAEAWHDGYAEHRHRRTILRTPAGASLIVDDVLGTERTTAASHWHFDPLWSVSVDGPGRLRASQPGSEPAWLLFDDGESELLHGDEASGLGWFAPVYGTIVPTWSARLTRNAPAPFSMVTWIATGPTAPVLARVAVPCDTIGPPSVGVRVVDGDVTWMTMLRPGEPVTREGRACDIGAFHTDGRLLHYGVRDGQLVALAVCDASKVLALREGWLSIRADVPIGDLFVEIVDGRLDAWSSSPGAGLQFEGALVSAMRSIRVNGRELSARASGRAGAAIAASSWGEPGRIEACAALPVSRT